MSNVGISVLADPARRNSFHNPYNRLLADALESHGVTVSESTRMNRFRRTATVLHIHWPQNPFLGKFWRGVFGAGVDLIGYAIQRVRGGAVVWTAHNVTTHDSKFPTVERCFMQVFIRLLSGVIYMSVTSKAEAERVYPYLRNVPNELIPHGTYGDCYPPPRPPAETRDQLGLAQEQNVIGFIGEIRPYKGIISLLSAIEKSSPLDFVWLIAGRLAGPRDYVEETRKRIQELVDKEHQIVFIDRRLDDAEMVNLIEACDVLAFPYDRVTNSGAVVLGLERGKFVVTSDRALFREIFEEVGSGALSISEEPFTIPSNISKKPDLGRHQDFLDARAWPRIAERTVEFFCTLSGK